MTADVDPSTPALAGGKKRRPAAKKAPAHRRSPSPHRRIRRRGGEGESSLADFQSMLFKGGSELAELEGGRPHRRASPHRRPAAKKPAVVRRRRHGGSDDGLADFEKMLFSGGFAEAMEGGKPKKPRAKSAAKPKAACKKKA